MTYVSALYRTIMAPITVAQPVVAYAATVNRAPAGLGSPVGVTLDNASDRASTLHSVAFWPKKAALPAVGDRCLVVFDDSGEPSIESWKDSGWG